METGAVSGSIVNLNAETKWPSALEALRLFCAQWKDMKNGQ